jgi:hypothetical protein
MRADSTGVCTLVGRQKTERRPPHGRHIPPASLLTTTTTTKKKPRPPLTTLTSMSGYNMEGTKKRGLSAAQKKKAMAKAKEEILSSQR